MRSGERLAGVVRLLRNGPLSYYVFLPGDRRLFVAVQIDPAPVAVSVLDASDGHLIGRTQFATGDTFNLTDAWASPVDTTILVDSETPGDRIGAFLERWIPALGISEMPGRLKLVDAATGQTVGTLPGGGWPAWFNPDGRSIGRFRGQTFVVWDVPPRRPLSGFAIAAGLLALPLCGWAWQRPRRLRRAVHAPAM